MLSKNYRIINGKKYYKDKTIFKNKSDTERFNKKIREQGGSATTIKAHGGYISVYRLNPKIKKEYKVRNTGKKYTYYKNPNPASGGRVHRFRRK